MPLQMSRMAGRRGNLIPLQMTKTARRRGMPAICSWALVFLACLCYTSFIFNGRSAMSVLTKRERARVMPLSIMRLRQRKVVPRMRPFSVGAFFMKKSNDRRILW